MSFNQPFFLFLFIAFLFLIPYFFRLTNNYEKRQQKIISFEAGKKLNILAKTKTKYVNLFLRLLTIFFTIIALARPLNDGEGEKKSFSQRDLVFLLDISESMKAEDVGVANETKVARLIAGKKLIREITENFKNERVSLVAFAGEALPILPLTSDYDIFNSFLENIDYSYGVKGGTNINEAIKTGIKRFEAEEKKEGKVIFIFSDGENQEKNDEETIKQLKQEKITVFSIGTGTKEGAKIPLGKDFNGKKRYKTYLGKEIITKLEEKELKKVAEKTGGKYFYLNEKDLGKKIRKFLKQVKGKKIAEKSYYHELFPVFILFALILFLSELYLAGKEKNINY